MLRVILIPFFVVCELIPYSWGKWAALAIFVAASITDKLDGTIARKYNLITNFGKFMDPLADKLLVCSAMICFVGLGTLAPAVWNQLTYNKKRDQYYTQHSQFIRQIHVLHTILQSNHIHLSR